MRVVHDQHSSALRAYVLGLTGGDRGRAEDVVQETLLRAWRRPEVLDQSNGSARGWLFTVAKRIVIDEWRSSRTRPEVVTDVLPEPAAPDMTETSANRSVVVQPLSRLTLDHRQVLLECYIRGSSVGEASLRLGIPPGTVKSRTQPTMRCARSSSRWMRSEESCEPRRVRLVGRGLRVGLAVPSGPARLRSAPADLRPVRPGWRRCGS